MNLNSRSAGSVTPRALITLAAIFVGVTGLMRLDGNRKSLRPSRPVFTDSLQIGAAYGRLPLSFEPNQGQTDSQVKFLAHGGGYGLYLTGNGAVLALRAAGKQNSVVGMSLENANGDPIIDSQDQLPGKSNYFIGNDPAQWHRNIPQFARVRYREVYPGINLVYYGSQGKLEYDFEVAPGADPQQIALRYRGADRLQLTPSGDLDIATGSGEVQLQTPRMYQNVGNQRRAVAGKFVLRGSNRVGFDLGPYDRSRALIIDPVLSYSTYLGGTGSESCSAIEQAQLGIATAQFTPGCPAIAVDSAFRTYIAGATTSVDFPGVSAGSGFQKCLDTAPANPVTPVSPSPCPTGLTNSDVFVARLNATGTAVDFATYLGGSGSDVTAGMAVDQNFNVHIAGTTNSANFPTLVNSYQPAAASAGTHVFVSEVAAGGAALLYSTYLSGSGTDIASGIAIDTLGKEYVTGTTTSPAFPTTPAALQTTPKAANQYFFTKLDPTITGPGALLYSTYIGGSTPTTGVTMGGGIAVDSSCNAYLTGGTNFTDMPTLNAFQGTNLGGLDAWVAKFSAPSGSACGSQLALTYLTYFGGTGDDIGYGIAVDTGLSAYITGSTTSPSITLPTGSGNPVPFASCLDDPPPATGTYPLPPCPSGLTAADAFIAKFGSLASNSTSGTNVPYLYFTYLGGTSADTGTAIATDNVGGALVTGWTDSTDFPNAVLSGKAVQKSPGGGEDAFVARIDTSTVCSSNPPTVVCPGYSTYLGGNGTDIGTGIALDSQSSAYVTGETASTNFPVLSALQSSLNGASPDAFVTKLGPIGSFVITPATPTTIGVGNQVTFTYTVVNNGDPASNIIVTDLLPSSQATFDSISTSQGSCGTAVGSTVTCSIGTLNSGASITVTVDLTPTAPVTPLTSPGAISNSISVTAPGAQTQTASSTAPVQDFNIAVEAGTPSSITVPAGVPANFTFQVTGTFSNFPDSISLSAASGLPTPSNTSWTTNPIPSLVGSAQTSTLTITTTARVTTTGSLWHGHGPLYATWLPISGMAFLGLGIGGKMSRKRRALVGLVLGGFLALVLFQAGCSSKSTTSTTTGTPAGTYVIAVDATSGSVTRTTTVTLIVQ
ncbi:MAG: SBBP repeat-containing protein [Terriglobales bacterium]